MSENITCMDCVKFAETVRELEADKQRLQTQVDNLLCRIDALESVGKPAHIYSKILEWMDGETGQSVVCSRPSFEAFHEHYEKLKADAARLDWVQKNEPDICIIHEDGISYWQIIAPLTVYGEDTLREAIDAAMEGEK